MNLPLRWRLLAACGSGILLPFAFAPYNARILPWLGLVLLMQSLLGASARLAATCGLLHGLFFYGLTVRWVYDVMRLHGGLTPIYSAGALLALVLYLSIYSVIFSLLFAYISRRGMTLACITAPFLWVAVEFARTHAPILGFPWNLLGNAVWYHLGMLQMVTVTGIYGLSFLLAAYNALLTWALVARSRKALTIWFASTLFILAAEYGGRQWVPVEQPREAAYLVQTNFPEAPSYPANWLDLHAGEMDELEKISVDAVRQGAASAPVGKLIVWPEVPAPFYFLDPKFAARAERIAQNSGAHFLSGVVEWRPAPDGRILPYNSAVMLDPTGRRVFQYDKIHLVPFGEYVPLRSWLKFAEHLVAEVGDYQPGSEYSVGQLPGGKFGVGICYEAIFPNEIRQFTANGAELLINISNDGWYGRSAAPDHLLAMARVRAVENRRWLLRGTNNGYTVAIDPYGREVATLDADIRGVLRAPFSFRSDRTVYSRYGDWFAWVCVIASLGFLLWPGKEIQTEREAN